MEGEVVRKRRVPKKIKHKDGLYGQPPNLMEGNEFFFIRVNKAYTQVRYEDLLYCESLSGGYTRVVTKKLTYIYNNTLKVLQDHLPAKQFCRIHAGFIVGIAHIAAFEQKKLWLHEPSRLYKKGFAHRREFPIGTRYVESMRNHLVMAASRFRAYSSKTIQKLETDTLLEEMEWD